MPRVDIAVGILHKPAPDRDACVRLMQQRLPGSRSYVSIGVSGHPDIHRRIWDDTRLAWDRLLMGFPKSTHILLLHDDILLCRNFYLAAGQIVELLPDSMLQFFGAWDPGFRKAHREGSLFYRSYRLRGPHATLFPRARLEDFLQWSKEYISTKLTLNNQHQAGIDEAAYIAYGLYLRQPTVYTVPGLVQHLPSKSTWDPRSKNIERLYVGDDADPLRMDWRNGVYAMYDDFTFVQRWIASMIWQGGRPAPGCSYDEVWPWVEKGMPPA